MLGRSLISVLHLPVQHVKEVLNDKDLGELEKKNLISKMIIQSALCFMAYIDNVIKEYKQVLVMVPNEQCKQIIT